MECEGTREFANLRNIMLRHVYVIRNENLYWKVNELSFASSQQGLDNCHEIVWMLVWFVIYSIRGLEISDIQFVVVTMVYISL